MNGFSSNTEGFNFGIRTAHYEHHSVRPNAGDSSFTGTTTFSNNVTTAISCGAHLVFVPERRKFNGFRLQGANTPATATNHIRMALYKPRAADGFVETKIEITDSTWKTWSSVLVAAGGAGGEAIHDIDFAGEVWLTPGFYWAVSMAQSNYTSGSFRTQGHRSSFFGLRNLMYKNAAELTANASYASQNFPTGWTTVANFEFDTLDTRQCSWAVMLREA